VGSAARNEERLTGGKREFADLNDKRACAGDFPDSFIVGLMPVRRRHADVGRDGALEKREGAVCVRALEEVTNFNLADPNNLLG